MSERFEVHNLQFRSLYVLVNPIHLVRIKGLFSEGVEFCLASQDAE